MEFWFLRIERECLSVAKDGIPEGWSVVPQKEEIPEGWQPVVGRGEDAARSLLAGLAEGTAGTIGGPGDLQKAVKGNWFDEWLTHKAQDILPDWFTKAAKPGGYALARPEVGEVRLPTSEEVSKTTHLDALNYDPQYYTGHLTKGAGSFVPGAVLGTSARSLPALALDVARFGVVPGAAQEAAGQAFKGTQYEGTPIEAATRFGTSLVAGAGAGKFLSPNVSKAPISSQQTYAGQVRQLEEHGMPISPGERSDSRALRYGESEANPEMGKERMEAVTRLATSRIGNGQGGNHGTNTIDHTPGPTNTINNILRETGSRVGNVWSRSRFIPDGDLGADIHNLTNEYAMSNLYGRETVNRLAGAAQELQDALHHAMARGQVILTPTGKPQPYLNGETAHRLYSRMRGAARGADEHTAAGLNDFANALGANMERSVAGTPHAGELAQANRDYRNALVVEKASKASNVAASAGYITPAKVEEAASQVFGSRAHQRGFDDFGWAPAAKSVYKVMPDSGTSPREQYHAMFAKWGKPIGFALGSLAGKLGGGEGTALEHSSLMGGLFGEAAAGAPEWLLRKMAGVYSQSRLGQAHLGNQALAGAPGPVYERVYHPQTGETTRRYSLPGLLTAAQTAELDAQRERERERNR
jgi:hypothetical protein